MDRSTKIVPVSPCRILSGVSKNFRPFLIGKVWLMVRNGRSSFAVIAITVLICIGFFFALTYLNWKL